MLAKIDWFLARHVFWPPVIAICQWTGFTQWKLSRDLMFLAFASVCYASARDGAWVWFALNALLCIFHFLRAALIPADKPELSLGAFRFMWLAYAVLVVPPSLFSGDYLWLIPGVLLPTAEYAAMLPTIPPKKDRKRKLANA